MQLTAGHLNRATLARQLLLERHDLPVVDAVHAVCALQGQEPAAPYVALAARLDPFDPAHLDDALRSLELVKATLMRGTLHVVTASDYDAYRAAMARRLRASLHDRRVRDAGLSPDEADALVPALLDQATSARTSAELLAWLTDVRGPGSVDWLWWALRAYAPLVRAPGDAPWVFAQGVTFLAAPGVQDPRLPGDVDAERGAAHLLRRYLAAFGPASVADIARFTLLTRTRVRAVLATIADEVVEHTGPAGEPLLDLAGAPLPDPSTPAPPRLLGMWDSVLLAHDDRTRVVSDEVRALVVRRNGDTLPTVLVDGRVRGVWRQVDGGIEITPFGPLDDAAWVGLGDEARRLLGIVADRPAPLFGRYDRWWRGDHLPEAGRRVVPA